jgi:hypothetical protein
VLPAGIALAAPFDRIIGAGETVNQDITVMGNDLIVEEGALVNGDVTVFDGDVELAGTVDGDVSIFDGRLELTGEIDGDLVLFGGELDVRETAAISGDCVSFGGTVSDDSGRASCASPGREILGNIRPPLRPELPEMPEPPEFPRVETRGPSFASSVGNFFLRVIEVVGRSLLLGLLALVVAAVFPRQLGQVSHTVRQRPAASGAVGLLTAVAAPSLIVLLLLLLAITCVGIILYPAVFLLGLAVIAAALMGWIALGERLGRWLVETLKFKSRRVTVTATLGTAVLTLFLGVLGLVPPFMFGGGFGALLLSGLLVAVGLGATTLTRFGTRPYPPGSAPPLDDEKVASVLETLPEKGSDE